MVADASLKVESRNPRHRCRVPRSRRPTTDGLPRRQPCAADPAEGGVRQRHEGFYRSRFQGHSPSRPSSQRSSIPSVREAQGPVAHDQRRTEWIPWPGHAPSPSAPPSAPKVPLPSHAITKFVVRSVGASMRAGVGGHPGPVWPRTHTSAKYLTWVCLGCGHGLAQRPQYRQRAARSDTGVTEQQRAHPGQPRRPASRVAPERNTRASAIPACPIAWTRLAGLDSGGAGRAGGMRHAAPAGSRSPRAT